MMSFKFAKYFNVYRLVVMALLPIVFAATSHATPHDSYFINIKMNVKLLPAGSNSAKVMSNQKIFINTLKSAPSGMSVNQYLTTDKNGHADFTVGADSVGAIFTIYLVDSKSDSIRLNCKLARVNDLYMNYLTVPTIDDLSEEYDMVLAGSHCQF